MMRWSHLRDSAQAGGIGQMMFKVDDPHVDSDWPHALDGVINLVKMGRARRG